MRIEHDQQLSYAANLPSELSATIELLREHWQRQLLDEKIAEQLKLYIPAMLGNAETVRPEQRKSAFEAMQTFLHNKQRLLLLLGDSGAGKTLLGQWFVNQLWEHQPEWLPLFLHLPAQKINNDLLVEYLKRQCNLSDDKIKLLKEKCKLFLVLDSYDEMKIKHQGKNLYRLAKLYHWNLKVVISCRTEALVRLTAIQQRDIFMPYQNFDTPIISAWDKSYVQFFDPKKQIPDYIQRWQQLNSELVDPGLDYLQVIKAMPGLSQMITNPFILSIVVFVLPKLLTQYNNKPVLERYNQTRLDLYDQFTQAWFERQRDKLLGNASINDDRRETIVHDFRCYCEQLANLLWQRRVNSVKYDTQNDNSINKEDRKIWDVFFAKNGNFNEDPEKPLSLIHQGAMLRIFNGKIYAFLHTSLLEYFSASSLFKSAANKASIALGKEINIMLFTTDPAMIRLGVDKVREDPTFEQVLRDIIEESKHEPRVEIAAANAITILVAANKSFARRDLRRIRIRYANIAGGNFEGADLREADLRDVNLAQAWLRGANLTGSCVDRIKIGKLSQESFNEVIVDCSFSTDTFYYAIMTRIELYIYETSTHNMLHKHSPLLKEAKCTDNNFMNNQNERYLTTFTFMPISNQILLGTDKGEIILINYLNYKVLRRWTAHEEGVGKLLISSNNNLLLSYGHRNGEIKRWDCRTWEKLPDCAGYGGDNGVIALLQNSLLLTTCDEAIRVWEVTSNHYITSWASYDYHDDGVDVTALAPTRDNRSVLSGYSDGTIRKWDCATGNCLTKWQGHTDRISSLTVSADGNWLLSGADDKSIKRWDLMTGDCVTTWRGHSNAVIKVVLSPDNAWFISIALQEIKRWESESNNYGTDMVEDSNSDVEIEQSPGYNRCVNRTETLALSGDGRRTLIKLSDGQMKLLDCTTGHCISTWQVGKEKVNALALSPDGSWALFGEENGLIKRIECISGKPLESWIGHKSYINQLAVVPGDRWALSYSSDGTIKRWDCSTSQCIATWQVAEKHVWAIECAFSADGAWALTSTRDGMIKQWDCMTGANTIITPGDGEYINQLSLSDSQTGLWVASLSGHKHIRVWDVNKRECVARWKYDDSGHYTVLASSPDGLWIVWKETNFYSIKIYHVNNAAKHGSYTLPFPLVKLIWSSADPSLILMAGLDGNVSAWTFQADTASLCLRWRYNLWELQADDCQMTGVYGLPPLLHQVFTQKGAKVQVSAKSSEDSITPEGEQKQGVLTQRNHLQRYNPKNRSRSLFDHSMIVSENSWVVSVSRRKDGDAKLHAFMILESIEEGYYRIRRIDFILEQRHRIIHEGSADSRRSGDIFGLGLIEVADKSLSDMQSLVGQCCAISSSIHPMQGLKLLENIRNDQKAKIGYCLMGSGAFYRMFRTKEALKHHNCLSWCNEHLEKIDVDNLIKRSWIDGVVAYTPWVIPDEDNGNNDDPERDRKCITM